MNSKIQIGGNFENLNNPTEHQVLRKAGMLKGSWLSVTEDMSRRIRESRHSINITTIIIKTNFKTTFVMIIIFQTRASEVHARDKKDQSCSSVLSAGGQALC